MKEKTTRNCKVYQGCTKLVPITPTETDDVDKVEWRDEYHLTHKMIEDLLLDMSDLLNEYLPCMTAEHQKYAKALIEEADGWETTECQVEEPTIWDNQ